MPYVRVIHSEPVDEQQARSLVRQLIATVAASTGKDEDYVMAFVEHAPGGLGADAETATFVDVRSIGGLNDTVNRCLAAELSDVLQRAFGTPPERVYLNFTDIAAYNWGWNGKTFG